MLWTRLTLAIALSSVAALAAEPAEIRIKTLSTDPAYVTGGDVLVQVSVPAGAAAPKISVGDRDVTGDFRPGTEPNTLVGLVKGLPLGGSTIRAGEARLDVTNYPITGPVLSGPWIQPFVCQTDQFKLPDGTTLGAPLDANCSAKTVVQYIYFAKGSDKFKPLADPKNVPADVDTTTISTGATVRMIARVETGTMNRGIYQNVILHDPATDPDPTPFTPPKGWNHRLVAVHGVGCISGWYIQGGVMGVNILERERLSQGYAIFTNTLNHPTNSCNAIVAGETTMMGKEHFIETFGAPFYTFSTGQSGGAYTSLQVADAFPGLFDGISIALTFPDALDIATAGLDAHLLAHYFTVTNPDGLTETQKVAISGYQGMQAFIDAANQSQRTDPVPDRADVKGYLSARWNDVVPESIRYNPQTNAKGARPTVFDAARNIYGVDPATGFALRPFDNVGVQYGLNALNAGVITPTQFLDMNEKIGGADSDGNYIAGRAVGDPAAIQRTYQSDLLLSGHGGLANIPIFDNATSREDGGYHYGWFHWAVRERLRQANGNSNNMVMWRSINSPKGVQDVFDRWMTAYMSDKSDRAQITKVLANKPADAADGCWDKSEPKKFIAEELVFSSKPVSECSKLYPVYSSARVEAGGPLANNVLKCQLKPVDMADYKVPFSADEQARLEKIFAGGVCDFAKPGVNQTPNVTWPSFGPSPRNLVYSGAGN